MGEDEVFAINSQNESPESRQSQVMLLSIRKEGRVLFPHYFENRFKYQIPKKVKFSMGRLTWLLKAKRHDFQLISAGERKNED